MFLCIYWKHTVSKETWACLGFFVCFRSAGKTDISVGFSCHFQSKVYSHTQFYTASAGVQVIPDPPLALGMLATWLLPPNYKTSSLLPQPQSTQTSSESTASGKRSIIYSILQVLSCQVFSKPSCLLRGNYESWTFLIFAFWSRILVKTLQVFPWKEPISRHQKEKIRHVFKQGIEELDAQK